MLARSLLATIVSAVLYVAAGAATVLDRCQDSDPKVSIAACTALIESGKEPADFLATLYGIRAMAYYKAGQYTKAVVDMSKTIKATKNIDTRVDLLRFRAMSYFALTDYPHAIADYTEVIRIKPSNYPSYNDRAFMFLKSKNYAAAVADYTVALNKKPDIALALFGRGLAKRGNGDIAGADIDMAKAKAIQSNIADAFVDVGTGAKQ